MDINTDKIAKEIENRLNVFCCIESPTSEECAEIINEVLDAIFEVSTAIPTEKKIDDWLKSEAPYNIE